MYEESSNSQYQITPLDITKWAPVEFKYIKPNGEEEAAVTLETIRRIFFPPIRRRYSHHDISGIPFWALLSVFLVYATCLMKCQADTYKKINQVLECQ